MNTFINGVNNELEKTQTENGANAYKTTKSPLVDLFATIGSLREREIGEVELLFRNAFNEDPLLATKMAFYARNIRGGLGERQTFRTLLVYLANNYPEIVEKNIYLISEFGRWDDLYCLIGTPVEESMWSCIALQFIIDVTNFNHNKPISLLAKWLKSINTSSAESRKLGKLTAKNLKLTERNYRVILSILRARIDIVEARMSNQEWDDIIFSTVPSKAMMNYSKAFYKRLPEKFIAYMEKVNSGEEKINAGAIYPYEILESLQMSTAYGMRNGNVSCVDNPVAEAQWKALPNYVTGENNFLVMADTSGSMEGRPLATALSLAIYFAERNRGEFKDLFLAFSSRPRFIKLEGNTLSEKLRNIESIVDNTDLESAFELVLDTALMNNVRPEDMPKALIVISDCEIDDFSYDKENWSFLAMQEKLYNAGGYELPKVVMWNVESRQKDFIDRISNPNIQFISGSSPSVFRSLINGITKNAYELMVDTLNDPMYDRIII